MRYAAGQHLEGSGEDGQFVRCVSAQLEDALPANAHGAGKGEEADALTRNAGKALEHLRKLLTSSLKGFPVAIDSLSASSPALRYTSLFPPNPSLVLEPTKSEMRGQLGSIVLRPLHVVATLSSGRWPAAIEALRKAKTALIIRLSELLAEQLNVKSVVHETCLDVVISGYLFRVDFYVAQELELCAGHERGVLHRNLVACPLHSSIVHGLHARFLSYSSTVRLMLLWLESEMFTGHVSQEALELLVAAVYLENGDLPLSSTAGFLKSLMKLAEHNWQSSPLIVDVLAHDGGGGGRSLSSLEIESVHAAFDALRAKSAMTILPLFIVSNATRDAEGGLFPCFSAETESVVLRLIIKSARQTAKRLLEWISDPFYDDGQDFIENLFLNDRNSIGRNVVFAFDRKLLLTTEANGAETNPGNRLWKAFLTGAPFAQLQLFSNLSAKERAFERMILM